MHLRILADHQKLFFRKDIFYCLEWLKTCFYAFAHTSRPPETFFRKDIFDRQEWLKICFGAFPHTSRPPETFFLKRYFLLSGVVTNVFLCIFANFHTTRNFFSEKIFFTVWSGYKRVFMHFRKLPYHQKLFFRKDISYCLE
jgi:hypothetical protein